jgi:coproporphyrinogen III oxidase-like Fe-S oxidoreductase
VRKCPYCDFNSHEASGEMPETEYLNALRADLESALPLIWGRKDLYDLHRRRHAQPVVGGRAG